jgi:D-3-phosphoglycerate dehydrogenase
VYKIKTLNNIAQVGLDQLAEAGLTLDYDDAPDGILVRSADMHSYARNTELLAIARAGAGTNNIPIQECSEDGIVVFNTPGANAEAVKELAVCALLLASRDVAGGIEWAKGLTGADVPKQVEKGKSQFVGPELWGKTLGVIGLGAVGAKVANAALSLGMTVYGCAPYLSVEAAWQLSGDVKHAKDLDTIYRNCDYITIHVPYIKNATHHMLSADAFDKMRDGVRIINLARGELVDDDAMLSALQSGKVARYVTDFPNERTVQFPNTIPLPHLGASTPESEEKCAVMAAREIADYLLNGNIRNSVNMPNVRLERIGVSRLCVIHRNVPRTITKVLDFIGAENINVEHMVNAPRGEYAYTLIDTNAAVDEAIADRICSLENVLRVRVI